jgi:hypothetical protein
MDALDPNLTWVITDNVVMHSSTGFETLSSQGPRAIAGDAHPFWGPDVGQVPDLGTYMDPHDVAVQILRVILDPRGADVTDLTISRG